MHLKFYVLLALVLSQTGLAISPVRELLGKDLLEDALPVCRQYEVLATNDLDSNLACGWVYLRLGKSDAAEKILSRLQKRTILPEYQLLVAYSYLRKKQYESSRNIIDSVMQQNRGTPIGYTAEELSAELYEVKGQLDAAAFIYRQIISWSPNRGRAHWGLGRFYLGNGDLGKAKMHLERTTALWPKHVASRFNLGVLSLTGGNLREAGIWLSRAYKLNHADVGVLEQLGVLFEQRKQIAEAVRYWEKAVALDRNAPFAKDRLEQYLTTVVDNLMQQRQYNQALAKIESVGKDLSKQPGLMLKRAIIYKHLGIENNERSKIERAVAELTIYLNQMPNDVIALREQGICYVNLANWEMASSQFEKLIQLEPENGINYAWNGFVYESTGNFVRAREMYRTAVNNLKDPAEVVKANRKLASIEKKIGK